MPCSKSVGLPIITVRVPDSRGSGLNGGSRTGDASQAAPLDCREASIPRRISTVKRKPMRRLALP